MLRLLKRLLWLAILGGIAWGVVFFSSAAFGWRWRSFVIDQMAGRGIYLQFARLTVDPFRSVVLLPDTRSRSALLPGRPASAVWLVIMNACQTPLLHPTGSPPSSPCSTTSSRVHHTL